MSDTLLILPFDHRSSFSKKLLGYEGSLSQEQTQKVISLKNLVFEAFLKTRQKYEHPEHFGILVDEQFGTEIIQKARNLSIKTAIPVEKSGQEVFTFEYGEQFGEHIEKFKPTYVKALVRYNPRNVEINQKQMEALKALSAYCRSNNHKLLFELLVPPTNENLQETGSKENYDKLLRPQKTIVAINEIKPHVHVDLWKLEAFDKKDWHKVLAAVNPESDVIMLGRGASQAQVKTWLENTKGCEQIIGFAIGRTIFFEPLQKLVAAEITEKEAVQQISDNFSTFIDLWYRTHAF